MGKLSDDTVAMNEASRQSLMNRVVRLKKNEDTAKSSAQKSGVKAAHNAAQKSAQKAVPKSAAPTIQEGSVRTSHKTTSVPSRIGKYVDLEPLAEGGMGAVYKARDEEFGRTVVLKKLKSEKATQKQRDRFVREAAILSTLTSQHIVRSFETIKVVENGIENEYFVLEYVDGMSLDNVLEKLGPLPPQIAMWIFVETCKGLELAHHEGIVHRDIKPANVMIEKGIRVKLADFGISDAEDVTRIEELETDLKKSEDELEKIEAKEKKYRQDEKNFQDQVKKIPEEKRAAAKKRIEEVEKRFQEKWEKLSKEKEEILKKINSINAGIAKEKEEEKKARKKDVIREVNLAKEKGKKGKADVINETITLKGSMLGTPAYMSPEQILKYGVIDKRTDIFSMGVMLYEMVTGQRPYNGKGFPEQIRLMKKRRYKKPSHVVKGLPRVFDTVICKMIDYNPDKRFQEIRDVRKMVEPYLKSFNETEIRQELANRLFGSERYVAREIVSVKRGQKIFLAVSLLVIGLGGAIFALMHSGLVQRHLLKKWYAPVDLTLKMPENIVVPKELKPMAYFYKVKDDSLPELATKRRTFSSKSQADGLSRARTVFLRKGKYRLKVLAGPFVRMEDVIVDGKKQVLDLDFADATDRLVSFHVIAEDSESGDDLSSKVSFELESGEGRKKLGAQRSVFLKSGAVFDAYLSCPGYDEEHFPVEIGFYQNDVFIRAKMKKTEAAGEKK